MWISLTTTLLLRKSLHGKQFQIWPRLQIFNFIWEKSLVSVIISKIAFLKQTSERPGFQKLFRNQYLSGGNGSPYLLHLCCLETLFALRIIVIGKTPRSPLSSSSEDGQAHCSSGDGTKLAEVQEASGQCSDIWFYFQVALGRSWTWSLWVPSSSDVLWFYKSERNSSR